MGMYNHECFSKDCDSCKYSLTHTFCDDAKCPVCPNFDASGESGRGICSCCKDADTSLKHCPYYEGTLARCKYSEEASDTDACPYYKENKDD